MIRRATLLSFSCLLSFLVACSGTSGSDGGTNPDGGGNPGSDGGGGGTDAGGGGTDAGSCTPFSRSYTGQLSYVHTDIGTTTASVAVARFFTAVQTESGSICGGCTFTPVGAFDGGTTDAGTTEAAGNLTLVNQTTHDGGAMLELTTPIIQYEAFSTPWVGGDTLQMSGTGGAFPAFSVTTQQPDAIAGVSPNPLAGTTSVSRSATYTASWTPSAAPTGVGMVFSLATDAGVILCLSSDSAGSVSVPASVLGNLVAGTGGSVSFERVSTAIDTSTGQNITVNAALLESGPISVTP